MMLQKQHQHGIVRSCVSGHFQENNSGWNIFLKLQNKTTGIVTAGCPRKIQNKFACSKTVRTIFKSE